MMEETKERRGGKSTVLKKRRENKGKEEGRRRGREEGKEEG